MSILLFNSDKTCQDLDHSYGALSRSLSRFVIPSLYLGNDVRTNVIFRHDLNVVHRRRPDISKRDEIFILLFR
jgi:hypothetical protein